jgi:hypothetical protein
MIQPQIIKRQTWKISAALGPVVQNIYVIPNGIVKLNDYVMSFSYSIS